MTEWVDVILLWFKDAHRRTSVLETYDDMFYSEI